jgi:formiminotetrahydrofolate cyclodeaminase
MMAAAAAHGALANVEINLESLTDADYVSTMRARFEVVHSSLVPRPTPAAAG